MGRTAMAAVAVAVVLGVVSGCGNDPEPKFSHAGGPSPTPVTSSPAASASADPSPPKMPDAAKMHTGAGAKAFTRYLFATVSYSQRTLDLAPLKRLFSGACQGCDGGVAALQRIARRNGSVNGGDTSVVKMTVNRLKAGALRPMEVLVTTSSQPMSVKYPGGKKESYPGGKVDDRLVIYPSESGWVVGTWEGQS